MCLCDFRSFARSGGGDFIKFDKLGKFAKISLKCLVFTQNTSNLVQNVHNVDLKHSRMK